MQCGASVNIHSLPTDALCHRTGTPSQQLSTATTLTACNGPSGAAGTSSTICEMPHFLRNSKVHYHVRKSPLPVAIMRSCYILLIIRSMLVDLLSFSPNAFKILKISSYFYQVLTHKIVTSVSLLCVKKKVVILWSYLCGPRVQQEKEQREKWTGYRSPKAVFLLVSTIWYH